MTSYLPHGRVAMERSVVYVRACVVRLRWSPSLRWRAVFKVQVLMFVKVLRDSRGAKSTLKSVLQSRR